MVMSKMGPGQSPPPSTSSGLVALPISGPSLSSAAAASPHGPWAALHQAAAATPSPSLGAHHSPDYANLPPGLSGSMAGGANTLTSSVSAITSSAGMLHPAPGQVHQAVGSPFGASNHHEVAPPNPGTGPTLVRTPRSPQARHARFVGNDPASRPPSPRLHSLPDNTLNPLGLLAEASLHSRHRHRRRSSSRREIEGLPMDGSDGTASDSNQDSVNGGSGPSSSLGGGALVAGENGSRNGGAAPTGRKGEGRRGGRVGVANQAYFQPGPMNILPLRRIVIEQRMPPSLLTDKVLTSEEAVELFQIYFERCNPQCVLAFPCSIFRTRLI